MKSKSVVAVTCGVLCWTFASAQPVDVQSALGAIDLSASAGYTVSQIVKSSMAPDLDVVEEQPYNGAWLHRISGSISRDREHHRAVQGANGARRHGVASYSRPAGG
ncbi:MAG: hypothetical protein GF410_12200, partial [Chitinivibrionales bacterium]|nr:hypothetical protein [Chitinivibrionales bacterium]